MTVTVSADQHVIMSPAVYDVTIDYFWSTPVVCNVQIEYLTEPVVDGFSDIFLFSIIFS